MNVSVSASVSVCDTFLCAALVLLPRVSSAPGCRPCCLSEKQPRLEKGEKGRMDAWIALFLQLMHALPGGRMPLI